MEENSFIHEDNSKCLINDLPDEVIEYILSLLPPYKDLEQCMLVCKRWQKVVTNVIHRKKSIFIRSICDFKIKWDHVTFDKGSTITKRYSHSACSYGNSMYVFGGCTCTSTTFNDLWRLDLSTRQWIRLLTMGVYPTPKACATLVHYNNSLVLFGGWTHPSSYPLHQQWRMFNELHIYDIHSLRWTCVITPTLSPPSLAGHSATVHGDTMVVFGGLYDNNGSSNDVWCFDLVNHSWKKQPTTEPKPIARYGQSQIVLDYNHLIILGGCGGGPNIVLNDVWMLDMTSDVWTWKSVQVQNSQWAASHLWCHPACKVGNTVVVFSRHPRSTMPGLAYSKWSPGHQPSHVEQENSALHRNSARCTAPHNIDRDVNVNGRRGSLTPRYSLNVDVPGPSQHRIRQGTDDPRRHSHPDNALSNSHNIDNKRDILRLNGRSLGDSPADGSMAAFRDSTVNSLNQRERQLEALRRMEERIRQFSKLRRDFFPPPVATSQLKSKMAMFVMDISCVLSHNYVSWLPMKLIDNSPEDTILYSLVVGNCELIMFGGIQKDSGLSVSQSTVIDNVAINFNPMNIDNKVSNTLHFITAPSDVI